ncbi:UDP-glucose 4-epimerase [Albidovulum inexpectatum]|uniref:UDP-glucose 4-epimerase n=1 Tax=Albidovulum inexpectatum TaxID=196587 RepID=A0A2S5JDN2_9RHOB|nr:NAD-dependent epimerase/dehydratase family protein [Albidovulum inexpectatum]PPB79518.1 UDP-glucose 4-epimerase [Albidovulum inexpectatum]
MKILITGGAGFIGSHLAERLIREGHDVTALDDLSTGRRENLVSIAAHPRFRLVEGSVLDTDLVEDLVDACDLVFHLAAAVGVKLIMEQPSRSILTNVGGTEAVLKAALRDRKPVFVASTSEVYGKSTRLPFHEDDDLVIGATRNLRWSYASAKQIDEFLALAFAREADLPVVILRFFNTTGPRQTGRYGMVVPNFVQAALEDRPLTVHGDGQQSRCFGHVADVVEALVRLMDCDAARGRVFNIGNDQEVTIRALAERIIAMTGSNAPIIHVPYESVYPEGFEDMARRIPDVSRLEQTIGFRPRRGLDEIIADIVAEKRARMAA